MVGVPTPLQLHIQRPIVQAKDKVVEVSLIQVTIRITLAGDGAVLGVPVKQGAYNNGGSLI